MVAAELLAQAAGQNPPTLQERAVLLSQPGTWVGRVLWTGQHSSSSAQLINSATSSEDPSPRSGPG
jgi:hypothetical protein